MIRKMETTDWPQMAAIYSQSLDSGKATFETVCPSYDEWDASHIKDCRLVYEEDGRVIGYAMLSPTSKREAYKGVVETSIYVDLSRTHSGVGTALLSTLCEMAEEKGYWTLFAAIFSTNIASLALYRKCGFREIGYREKIAKDRFGAWQSTVLMERRSKKI